MLEKGSEIGAHILSGAVMDPIALNELFPDWKERGAPLDTPVTEDRFYILTETRRDLQPALAAARLLHQRRLLHRQPRPTSCAGWASRPKRSASRSFPDSRPPKCCTTTTARCAAWPPATWASARTASRRRTSSRAWSCIGKYTLFAEGARGHLGKQVIARFKLDRGPRSADLGHRHQGSLGDRSGEARAGAGACTAPAGRSTRAPTAAASSITSTNNQVAIGLVVGLGYTNPYLEPFQEFQRYKTHPTIRAFLEGGKRIAYGARAINASGLQSLPKLVVPGRRAGRLRRGLPERAAHQGLARGDQDRHAGRRCGVRRARGRPRSRDELTAYPAAFEASWLHDELHRARNFKPYLDKGLVAGAVLWGIDQIVFRGKAPWTLHRSKADHEKLRPAAECAPIDYPKPDNRITFDKLSSVFLSNTNHEENQPAHLTLKDATVPVAINLATLRRARSSATARRASTSS